MLKMCEKEISNPLATFDNPSDQTVDARWFYLHANAQQSTIVKTVDDAMFAIERDWQFPSAEAQMWN